MCREGDRCKYLHEEGCSRISSDEEQTKIFIKDVVTNPSSTQNVSESNEACSSTSSKGNKSNGRTEAAPCDSSSSHTEMSGIADLDSITSTNGDSNLIGGQINPEPVVCHFFQQGRCMFGNNCRNRHVIEDSVSSTSSSKSEDVSTTSLNNSSLPVPDLSELSQSGSSCVSSSTLSTHSSEDGEDSR